MGEYVIKLPDVGEGVAEAELVEWQVKVGDLVREDAVLAAVMTDKATVEIPSPVDGEIVWLGAEIGDTVAIGSPIVRLKVAGEGNVRDAASQATEAGAKNTPTPNPSPQGGGGRAATSKAEPETAPRSSGKTPTHKGLSAAGGESPSPLGVFGLGTSRTDVRGHREQFCAFARGGSG
ncbi:biotin/lipoyl-containing protein, partial [Mesorhizobium sp. M0859]|uniref:biotin/lipoyl-containing protein n=1 Tax=Mesorhizobium sp. M0859 TaxID=2957014 RepID=UPI003338D109